MTLPNYDLSVHLDYKNLTTSVNLTSPYSVGSTTSHLFRMYDEKGTIIQNITLPSSSSTQHSRTLYNSGEFGLRLGGDDIYGGYDTSIARQDLSGVNIAVKLTMWEMSSEYDDFQSTSTIENSITDSVNLILDSRDNTYLNTPLLIERGDAVVQGAVSVVTGDSYMSLTYDKSVISYTGFNINKSICQVISGANSGQTFAVTSHVAGQPTFLVDRDVNHLSGQIVKVMPYREVTSYEGWTYTGTTSSKLGAGGLNSRFGLDSNIPAGPGSIDYSSGTYSGAASIPYSEEWQEGDIDITDAFTVSIVALKNDTYKRDISPGDVIYFTPSSAPSAEATGVVLSVAPHAVSAEGDFAISYWPARQPTSTSNYKVYRKNDISLYSYPKLDKEYLCIARESSIYATTGEKYVTKVQTPSVVVDIAANEFESLFASIPESSHFHIGPVYLSNGQTLLEEGVGSNNILPHLYFSGTVYNGSPENPISVISRQGFSTQNPDAAHKHNGTYFSNGVMTLSANTTFNSSETVICKSSINYGSIKIDKVFTIPVQPSV